LNIPTQQFEPRKMEQLNAKSLLLITYKFNSPTSFKNHNKPISSSTFLEHRAVKLAINKQRIE